MMAYSDDQIKTKKKIRVLGIITFAIGAFFALSPIMVVAIVLSGSFFDNMETPGSESFIETHFKIMFLSASVAQIILSSILAIGGILFSLFKDIGRKMILFVVVITKAYCVLMMIVMFIAIFVLMPGAIFKIGASLFCLLNTALWLFVLWFPYMYFSRKAKAELESLSQNTPLGENTPCP
jgi:hypothetical protein